MTLNDAGKLLFSFSRITGLSFSCPPAALFLAGNALNGSENSRKTVSNAPAPGNRFANSLPARKPVRTAG
ncbi:MULTISPECIES: hypothetical protein [Enterobacterales]|uniref:hypothetical protein n=1 Tax=Enterobacterales TaxID=91347 RepID=UPI0011C07F87|nr:hypothetical protein [Serratia liquefaciens]MDW5500036.1 hypothetical protein [Serratia proteamaculans]MDW5505100.1 hypothetical protein [Pseudomonas lundensis]